ncbi:hypothetical protein [Rhizobium sp. B21/90]|uniref:hypothetical protein n=1 Tax=Rhizobium sp. B21/90 TaxID=2819993 RepID=UPI00214D135C|nr:hypothetical protein [Rhizobium sp. B21/90]
MTADRKYKDVVQLPNSLVIKNIAEVHGIIHMRLTESPEITLEIPGDAEADLSFVQLVESARMDARAAGKTMRLAAPATGSVLKVLKRGGFTGAQSAEDAQFWLHQEVRV